MSKNLAPEFGDRVAGEHYQPRPGSYGVIGGRDGRVLLVQTMTGLHLPGGGAEPGETPEQTLEREVFEECGHLVTEVRRVGAATQLVFAEGEGFFAKECIFFRATLGEATEYKGEADHMLVWLEPAEATRRLRFGSQRWAVAQTLG